VQLAIARKLQGVTTVGNQISVLGGRNGAAASGDVEVLTVTGGRVTAAQTRADLPGELRDGGRSAACNGRVLLSGGDENSNRSRRANETLLQSLDANPRAISFLVNPIQRAFHVVESVDNMVFVISGDAAQGITASVQAFNCDSLNLNANGGNRGDLDGMAWVQRAPIPTAVLFAGGTAVGQQIVVTGGRGSDTGPALNTTQIYDVTANSWKMGAPMPTARFGHEVVRLNDTEVMAVGGNDGQSALTTVEIYNVMTDQWRTATSLPMPLTNARGDNVGDNQVVIVGGTRGIGPNDASLSEILEFSLN
jgi:hypothetical protein